MRRQYHFDGLFLPAQSAAHPYHYVPFEVPPRCSRVEVVYHYHSDSPGPCTLDIGIFDVRGTEPVTGGFRGWSGSDRRQFFIEREQATPGYIAGPLPAGTWSVILGGYEVPESGIRWQLTVSLELGSQA